MNGGLTHTLSCANKQKKSRVKCIRDAGSQPDKGSPQAYS